MTKKKNIKEKINSQDMQTFDKLANSLQPVLSEFMRLGICKEEEEFNAMLFKLVEYNINREIFINAYNFCDNVAPLTVEGTNSDETLDEILQLVQSLLYKRDITKHTFRLLCVDTKKVENIKENIKYINNNSDIIKITAKIIKQKTTNTVLAVTITKLFN